MIENLKESPEEFKDYDSELLLKILNKTSLENKKVNDKELFVDENWKINSKNMSNIISSDNSNLKRILSDIFLNKDKKIVCDPSLLSWITIFLFGKISDNILFKFELSEGIILLIFIELIFQFSSTNSSLSSPFFLQWCLI